MTETKAEKPKRKKYRRPRTKLSYGPRGLETLKLAYQVGGFTAEQHSRFFDTRVKYSYRTLASLTDQRLLESAPIMTTGRPRDFHFLSRSNGSRAIAIGGHEAGVRSETKSKSQYKLHGLPAHVEHAHARNAFYLCLRDAASKSPGVEVPRGELSGESFRGFPLRGQGRGEKVYPDGLFEVRFEGLACRYIIEYESRSRPGYILSKLDAYGAHFGRRLKEDEDSMRDWLRPVVFLFGRSSTAIHASQTVSGAVRAEAPELRRYLAWRRAAANRSLHTGRLILLANMETITARGALGVEYVAAERYPEGEGVGAGGAVVDLETVAEEVAGAVARR